MEKEVIEIFCPASQQDWREWLIDLSKSVRKSILQWLVLAKRSETRQKRITEIVELAAKKMKPKQF